MQSSKWLGGSIVCLEERGMRGFVSKLKEEKISAKDEGGTRIVALTHTSRHQNRQESNQALNVSREKEQSHALFNTSALLPQLTNNSQQNNRSFHESNETVYGFKLKTSTYSRIQSHSAWCKNHKINTRPTRGLGVIIQNYSTTRGKLSYILG